MAREKFDRQLHQIQDEILLLGSMVEQAATASVDALKRRDFQAAKAIRIQDAQINDKRFAIENAILILMATQQPTARDLRILTAMLEVINELERMGDYAKGNSKVVFRLGEEAVSIPGHEFTLMVETGCNMLHKALTAFVNEDGVFAAEIAKEDDVVDNLYNKVYFKLITDMIAQPALIDHTNLLMWVAHNLERMADRVVNICERVVFIATGELIEFEPSDDEEIKL